jgi:8-oxo-dGTP pyrophosphatase MutT (NUDIX family)
MEKETKNPWTVLSSEEKYSNKWIRVTEHQVLNPAGGKGIYGEVHFRSKAIGVIPVDADGNTWLVGQFRFTLKEFHWEIPEGGAPFDEDPLEAAKRELLEETGLTAKRWTKIARLHTSNSVTDEEGFVYLAEDLTQGANNLDETEADLKTWRLPLKQAIEMVTRGEITDSVSMIGLLTLARIKGL